MVLRKPYAFLIKHFKVINLILFLSSLFCLNRDLKLYRFILDYIQTGVYNETLYPISNYIDIFLYFALVLIILASFVLFYLLKRKEKPFITYIYVMIVGAVSLVLFIYIHGYFFDLETFNGQIARLIRDFTLIDSFFYYPILVILLIRSLGIDLKSFGFYQDEEFISSNEEDREEVEVDVGFDQDKYIRFLKNKIRYSKYFFLEHKIPILGTMGIVFLIFVFQVYQYFYVENKIFKTSEVFTSNGYQMKINRVYLTDKDFAGNVISSSHRFFVVVDLNIKNLVAARNFDSSKLTLYVDDTYYVPTTRYNESFVDLGIPFQKNTSYPYGEEKSNVLVYEVEKPRENANFLLRYQDTTTKANKEIRIKIQVLDITSFKQRDEITVGNSITIPLNEEKKYEFSITNYELTDQKNYTYESCYYYNCPIYEKTLYPATNKTILFLKVNSGDTISDFLSFLKKYGKVKYRIGEEEKLEKVNLKITNYHGNYAYLEVSNQIKDANQIELLFTIRTNQYTYLLKG